MHCCQIRLLLTYLPFSGNSESSCFISIFCSFFPLFFFTRTFTERNSSTMKKYLIGALLAFGLMAASTAANSPTGNTEATPAMIRDVMPATVYIEARGNADANGNYRSGSGSGYIVDASGLIVTNCHVACNQAFLWVTNGTGTLTRVRAEFVAGDPRQDIAFIRISSPRPLPTVPLSANGVVVGEKVIAVGSPLGLRFTVTHGIVSAVRPESFLLAPSGLIQTDAAISPGNSGGPLFAVRNGRLEVVGMNTAMYAPNGSQVGLNFAVNARDVIASINTLRNDGTLVRADLGIHAETLSPEVAVANGVSGGVFINAIEPNSPAVRAGLQMFDIIRVVNKQPIETVADLNNVLANVRNVNDLNVEFLRHGFRATATVQANNGWQTAGGTPVQYDGPLGLKLADPGTPAYLQRAYQTLPLTGFNIIGHPMVSWIANLGPAHEAGLMPNLFIRAAQIEGMSPTLVESGEQLYAYIAEAERRGLNPTRVMVQVLYFVDPASVPPGATPLRGTTLVIPLRAFTP